MDTSDATPRPQPPPKHSFPHGLKIAVTGDEQAVFDLCLAAWRDNALAGLSEPKVWAMLRRIITDQHGVVAVIPGHGRLVGGVCLDAVSEWYSDDWQYWERFLFVHPAHRRSGHEKRLFRFMEWWAQESGAPVIFGVASEKRMAAKTRLYARYGRPIGAMFVTGELHAARPMDVAA